MVKLLYIKEVVLHEFEIRYKYLAFGFFLVNNIFLDIAHLKSI